jgi:protein TonB
MAHFFDAGMALRQECFEDIDAAAAEAGPFAVARSSGSYQEKPARWLSGLICSLALHLLPLAVLLSALDVRPLPPGQVAPGQVIAISLVDRPAAPSASHPGASPAPAPTPAKRPAPAPKAAVRPKPAQSRPPAPVPAESEPAPAAASEALSADGVSAATVAPEGEAGSGSPAGSGRAASDSTTVQPSVPLYELNPPPEYPMAARRRSLEGTVLLKVLVDESGQAAQVKVVRGSGHDLLDRSALDGVRKWRFTPGRRLGRPQPMWVQVPVRFQLN